MSVSDISGAEAVFKSTAFYGRKPLLGDRVEFVVTAIKLMPNGTVEYGCSMQVANAYENNIGSQAGASIERRTF